MSEVGEPWTMKLASPSTVVRRSPKFTLVRVSPPVSRELRRPVTIVMGVFAKLLAGPVKLSSRIAVPVAEVSMSPPKAKAS